jgi:hypothetical protein
MDWESEFDREVARATIRHLYANHNITYRPIVIVVATMAWDPDLKYWDALDEWSRRGYKIMNQPTLDWMGKTQWHAEFCYRVLKSGAVVEAGVDKWFEDRAKEVRELANRIHA